MSLVVGLLFSALLVVVIWALWSKHPAAKFVARAFTAFVTLTSVVGMVFLFGLGQRAHWTSDGPGMVFVMAGILLCGIFALIFGGLLFYSFRATHSS